MLNNAKLLSSSRCHWLICQLQIKGNNPRLVKLRSPSSRAEEMNRSKVWEKGFRLYLGYQSMRIWTTKGIQNIPLLLTLRRKAIKLMMRVLTVRRKSHVSFAYSVNYWVGDQSHDKPQNAPTSLSPSHLNHFACYALYDVILRFSVTARQIFFSSVMWNSELLVCIVSYSASRHWLYSLDPLDGVSSSSLSFTMRSIILLNKPLSCSGIRTAAHHGPSHSQFQLTDWCSKNSAWPGGT